MAGYCPCSCMFMVLSWSINTQKRTCLANIPPSWPYTWSITHIYQMRNSIPPWNTASFLYSNVSMRNCNVSIYNVPHQIVRRLPLIYRSDSCPCRVFDLRRSLIWNTAIYYFSPILYAGNQFCCWFLTPLPSIQSCRYRVWCIYFVLIVCFSFFTARHVRTIWGPE